jgi:hypothetical protein
MRTVVASKWSGRSVTCSDFGRLVVEDCGGCSMGEGDGTVSDGDEG